MSLFKCSQCRRAVARDALTCPHCGHPLWKKGVRDGLFFLARRTTKMRAVGVFCLASIIISIFEWSGGNILTFFPLVSGRPWGGGDFLLIALLTYSLIHWTLVDLFVSLFGICLLGCLLEVRAGSKTTGLVMVAGVLVVGLTWKFLLPAQGILIGSAGVTYAMAGGVARVGQRSWAEMERGERFLLVASALWVVIMLLSTLRSPLFVWIIPVVAMSVGALVVACRPGNRE